MVGAFMSLSEKNILVVGGSGVLGGELVRALSARGARVLATASSNEGATRIPAQAALRLLVNLADPASIKVLTDYLNATESLDGIVLAAGRVGFGLAADTAATSAADLMQLNFLGQAQLVTELLPNLATRETAFVAAITGIVAEKSFAGMAAYSASKSAMSSWLTGAGQEWRRQGIRVLDARPGHTETGLATRPLFGSAPQMPTGMTPSHVAETIIRGLESGAAVLSSGDF